MKALPYVCLAWFALAPGPALVLASEETELIFAVITEVPEDKSRVLAQVLAQGKVGEATLLADERVQSHLLWRELEMCHSIRAEAAKQPEGYRILSFKMVGASMLPMPMQGVAGDCMLKKALEYAPRLD